MNRFIILIMVFISLTLNGCFTTRPVRTEKKLVEKHVQMGSIVDSERIKSGGKVLIVPFKVGENVELNEKIDKVALRIVKGIAEELVEEDAGFEVLMSHNANDAEILIKGFITEFEEPSDWKKWIPGRNSISLGVEGKMVDLKTNKIICVFKDSMKTSKKEENHNYLGLSIGQNIGRFILSVKKK